MHRWSGSITWPLEIGYAALSALLAQAMTSVALAHAQTPSSPAPLLNAPAGVTAFVEVTVVPLDTERVLPKHTVLVQHGRITALGPSSKIHVPTEAVQIDGRGKYLIPGLADMHAHLTQIFGKSDTRTQILGKSDTTDETEQLLFLYAANGVTTIRNMDYRGPYGERLLRWRARAATGELWSPRIYTSSGDWHKGLSGSEDKATVADYVKALAAYKAAGFDFVKVYDGPPPESLVVAARQVGLPVAGHVERVEDALTLKYASIEHLRGYWDYLQAGDSSKMRAVAAETQRAGVWNCPTQFRIAELSAPEVLIDTVKQWQELRYVPAARREAWLGEQVIGRASNGEVVDMTRRLIKALQDAGAGLLLGTDAGVDFGVHGFSVHRELEALVRAGLTPYQALLTGTRNVAAFFRTSDESGTVAVGKRADLVLLTGNPLVDIRHTAQPAGVMIGGRWLPRSEIDRRLAELASAYAAATP